MTADIALTVFAIVANLLFFLIFAKRDAENVIEAIKDIFLFAFDTLLVVFIFWEDAIGLVIGNSIFIAFYCVYLLNHYSNNCKSVDNVPKNNNDIFESYSDTIIDTGKYVINKISSSGKYEVDSSYFDFYVSLPKCILIKIYNYVILTINNDRIVCVPGDKKLAMINDKNKYLIAACSAEYTDESLYSGNFREFLESFIGEEANTSLYRISEYTNLDNSCYCFCCKVQPFINIP